MRKMILLIISMLITSSCQKMLTRGKIVDKEYQPFKMHLVLIPQRVGNVTIQQYYWIYDNEDYVFIIHGIGDDGKEKTQKVYVSKSCYEKYLIGDDWQINRDCSFTDDNNSRKKSNN